MFRSYYWIHKVQLYPFKVISSWLVFVNHRCVRSPQLPYWQGLEQLLLPNLRPILVLHTVNYTQWNAINSPSVLWNLLHPPRTWFNAHFGNINNIPKTIRRCQMLTGGYTMKRINSDPILSLWSLRSLLECQSVVDVNSTGSRVTHGIHFDFH
jgi:hypothetical protein